MLDPDGALGSNFLRRCACAVMLWLAAMVAGCGSDHASKVTMPSGPVPLPDPNTRVGMGASGNSDGSGTAVKTPGSVQMNK
jgi:hypothetical protein